MCACCWSPLLAALTTVLQVLFQALDRETERSVQVAIARCVPTRKCRH